MTGGCGEDDSTDFEPPQTQEAAITYAQDIAPLMETHCMGCHQQGGAAPFALDTYDAVVPLASSALTAMVSGEMPPWLPDPECRTFEEERVMTPEAIDRFKAWVDTGMAPGDLSDSRDAQSAQTKSFEATHTASIMTPYEPSDATPDDYRCFILDLDFETEMYLTASTVLPDAGALVHHVLVYAISPDQLDAVIEANANENGEGYRCFGAPLPSTDGDLSAIASGGGLPTQVGAWVPGSAPQILPDGHGVRIEAGSKIVMQVHYNLLGAAPAPDQSGFAMRLTEQTPDFLVSTRPLIIQSLEIPAGDPEAINTRTYTNFGDKTLTIGAVTAHMHLLGSRYKATIERQSGNQECLLDIPRWDFNWQQSYKIPANNPLLLAPGDSITLECVYDNSPGHQPIVNGERIEPRDVTWGEGTLDEMCMLYMSLTAPFVPSEDPDSCGETAQCIEACEEGATACILGCAESLGCQICGLQSLTTCGRPCLGQFAALQAAGCLETCFIGALGLGSDPEACLASSCGQEYAALTECLDPILDAGTCDESLAACGIQR